MKDKFTNWRTILPYHIIILDKEQVREHPGDRILEALHFLYDHGPATNDWYVHEDPRDPFMMLSNQAMMAVYQTEYTFAFRHKSDAMMFKLKFG